MKGERLFVPPLSVRRGRVVTASYQDPLIPDYRNNPLIEALPPILTKEEAVRILACLPEYDRQQCMMPTHLRLHLLQGVTKLFVPSSTTLRLEQQISIMIRSGLVGRNPAEPGFWVNLEERVKSMKPGEPTTSNTAKLKASGLTVVGISGIGKSTTLERILLEIYPQVIIHNCYRGKKFTYVQIVYLHIDCPANGSLKSLCQNIVQAIDDLTGENYYDYYNCDRRTAENLVPIIARIASFHSLGLLVIDEIQNLSEARSGGHNVMLNFFVKLINDIGLPIVLVGTYKAMEVLGKKFRQARRGSGPSDLVWEPMKNDESWKRLIKVLWKYQFLRNPRYEIDPKLSDLLHFECQGITDIGIKLFLLSQIRVMTTSQHDEDETITRSIIKSVASDQLSLARPMLNALKQASKANADHRSIWNELKEFEDLYIDLQPYITQAEDDLVEFSSFIEKEDELLEEAQEQVPDQTQKNSEDSNEVIEKTSNSSSGRRTRIKRDKTQPEKSLQLVLGAIIEVGRCKKKPAYYSLKEAGFIKLATEFSCEVQKTSKAGC